MADGPPLVFVSYSRKDDDWRQRFDTMLKPVVRNRGFDLWSDARLVSGEQWRPELLAAIERSCAALLLITPSFLASSFIMEEELPAFLRRGTLLLPVLVVDCLWEQEKLIADVQWLHDPRDGAIADAPDPTRSIVRVCRRLWGLELASVKRPAQHEAEPMPSVPALAVAVRQGVVHGVPAAPPGFVEREELVELRATLLGAGAGRLGITAGRALGLHGQGGIGKTVLAAALARDDELLRHFPDGAQWVTLGERADLVAAQIDLLGRLGAPASDLRGASEGRRRLRAALEHRRCLIVVDDVWSAAAAEAFADVGPASRVLYTTRDRETLRAVRADVRVIGVLSRQAARELLAGLGGTTVGELPADVDRIIAATGCVPLAVALVGATVGRGGRSWQAAADELEKAANTFLDHPYANTFKAIQVGIRALDGELRAAYESLAVYPEDTRVPVVAVQRWWGHQHGLTGERTRVVLEQLSAAKLLVLDEDAIEFHDLQREFLLLHADSMSLLHHDLLTAYRALLPSPAASWRELPRHEPYIWEHLVDHLSAAGDVTSARHVATDLAFLALRSFRSGPRAAEADVRRVATLTPDDAAVGWVLRRISQWGHLLVGHDRISDLASTLATRTCGAPPGVDTGALSVLLPAVLVEPRWGLPEAPDALLRVLDGHGGRVWAVDFAPDGRTLASAGDDGTIRLWDPTTGSQTTVLEGHRGRVWAVTFAPDGGTLASAGSDETVRLWDPVAGSQTTVLQGHTGRVHAVAFAPDGRTLASAGQDRTVRLWDPTTGTQTAVLEGHSGRVWAVAFAPDGRTLASAGYDRTLRLWDPTTGTNIAVLRHHTGGVSAVAFAPDGRTLASASSDRTVRLWDPTTGTQTTLLEHHSEWVQTVAFTPDGRTLASASSDGTVRLWDSMTGTQTTVLAGRTGAVLAVAFAPDGSTLASTGDDGKSAVVGPHDRHADDPAP